MTGEQLDQSDLDVFLECLHRHQDQTLGTKVRFTAGSFLRAINRDVGKANYLWLNDVLARLSLYGIELGDGQRFYLGTLLNEMYRDEIRGNM
ncbi:replication initiator protein A [Pseudomonas cannabina]|uniref:replication initiator protein A n=1 Tax=Pseudomonas cannabina TaxID=86840 RepID=UPI000ABC8C48|nr:replication initiator protein A [Pseudomonas cannabina]